MGNDYIEKFWKYVDKNSSCWNWTGWLAGLKKNYGNMGTKNGSIFAHRFSYELHKGPIPDGFVIDHLCRNTICVNPDHLEAVTHRENLLRGEGPTAVNAKKTHCLNGHEYTLENTKYKPNGTRRCNLCHRERAKKSYHKNK